VFCAFYNVILVHNVFLLFIESMIIKYTLTCFTFHTNIITVDLEYIEIFPDSTLIEQHKICLHNISLYHIYITIKITLFIPIFVNVGID
jgi:hypothetical protein